MRFLYVFSLLLLLACGGEDQSITSTPSIESDSTDSGIIEYELNENRLSAVDYNNKLVLMQERVLNQVNLVFSSDSSHIDTDLDNAIFEIQMNLADLENTETPEGAEEFQKAMEDLLNFYQTELGEGFSDVKDLLKKADITEEENTFLTNFDNDFALKEGELAEKVREEQDKFAIANNFKVQ